MDQIQIVKLLILLGCDVQEKSTVLQQLFLSQCTLKEKVYLCMLASCDAVLTVGHYVNLELGLGREPRLNSPLGYDHTCMKLENHRSKFVFFYFACSLCWTLMQFSPWQAIVTSQICACVTVLLSQERRNLLIASSLFLFCPPFIFLLPKTTSIGGQVKETLIHYRPWAR